MVVNIRSIAVAAAVMSAFAAAQNLVAACATSVIAYQASGQFGPNVISGADTLKLAGEPFSITLYACESLKPTKSGPTYAAYYPIELTGQVKSSLLVQPYPIKPTPVVFTLTVPTTGLASVALQGPITISGGTINIKGSLALPAGTLTSLNIAPFAKVSIVTAKSEFTYSQGSNTTALSVIGNASGTVYTPPAAKAIPMVHTGAMQVITVHADGSQSIRPLLGALDPAASFDKTMLQVYASGVRDASEVHVQIAGQDVPVVYAGPSGHFPGLDEVMVEVPRSLAGMGPADVAMSVDGQPASPVRVHIQ